MENHRRKIKILAGFVYTGILSLLLLAGCDSGDHAQQTQQDSTATEENVPAKNPAGMELIRGVVITATAQQVQIKTSDSTVTVKLAQPFHLYARVPGTMADVKSNSFVGVTSHKQADGTEVATKINIFPEELRGLGEGSYMMQPDSSTGTNRMTNGSVAASRMTNGTAAPSRMSNGSVQSKGAATLEVQFQGHSKTVSLPTDVTVTTMQATPAQLTAGTPVALMAKKDASGALSSDKGIIIVKK